MRWKYGDTKPSMFAVDSATVIEIGDAVYLNTDDVLPASDLAWTGLNASQEALVDVFAGIAMQRSRAGDTDNIRVATAGVFEMLMASATAEVGDLFGADDNSTPDGLLTQQVIAVTDAARAYGVCSVRLASAATSILIEITSTIMRGGIQKGEASA
jgi:hypothetical protein